MILADAGNRAATNTQQWYVSISRGRKRVVVLTPDKIELRENIQRSGNRDLALDHGPANDIAQFMRIREHIELARRHQFYTQHLEHTQQVQQRT